MSQTPKQAAHKPPIISGGESRYRLIEESFASNEECRRLLEFADEYAEAGDGYGGNAHPHSPHETFAGYAFDGRPRPDVAPGHMLGLEVIQRTRKFLKRHYGVPFLWLDFGHLVVREADGQDTVEELSHPWHFDDRAEHVKHRTHTAILYLNDEFEGGLTCFKEADFGPYREIRPQPGLLVSFKAADNAHAVSKVKYGRRYVFNMWFSTRWQIWRRQRKILK